jgi:hypothetical protein
MQLSCAQNRDCTRSLSSEAYNPELSDRWKQMHMHMRAQAPIAHRAEAALSTIAVDGAMYRDGLSSDAAVAWQCVALGLGLLHIPSDRPVLQVAAAARCLLEMVDRRWAHECPLAVM